MLPKGTLIDKRHVSIYKLELDYGLYEEHYDGRSAFCVSVTLCDSSSGRVECESIFDITSLRDTADEIFRAVSDGAVTPMTLGEVIYDLLS